MIEQNQVRPIRKVAIADHLWEALDQMAKEMGTDRDGLVNQALFMFARLNGYLTPGGGAALPAAAAPTASPRLSPTTPRASQAAMRAAGREAIAPPPPEAPPRSPPPPSRPQRVSESASPQQAVAADQGVDIAVEPQGDEDSIRREVRERVFETAAELERLIKGGKGDDAAAQRQEAESDAPPMPSASGEKALYLMAEDGELDKVTKDRFLIGRGKHCDFIVNSGKVSREHAAIAHDGDGYFIEDLGSSNGTWFNKQLIKRRQIEDGDEYFICSEKIKCVIR